MIYTSLRNINTYLWGRLKALVGRAVFVLSEYTGSTGSYSGLTSGTNVTFYTTGDDSLRQMNIYHEFAHVLDNAPGLVDVFSNALGNLAKPSFMTQGGYLSQDALIEAPFVTTDPNYGRVLAIRHPSTHPVEQWADIFANYVAGNINLDKSQGRDMYNWITGVLAP